MKILPGYPSGSGLAYHNGRIYIVGDDATYILVLDSLLNVIDSIRIVESSEKRITKERKPDTEALAIIKNNNTATMLALGSGSLSPSRDSCYVLNLPGNEISERSADEHVGREVLRSHKSCHRDRTRSSVCRNTNPGLWILMRRHVR